MGYFNEQTIANLDMRTSDDDYFDRRDGLAGYGYKAGDRVKVVFDRVTGLNGRVGTLADNEPNEAGDWLVILDTEPQMYFAGYEIKKVEG